MLKAEDCSGLLSRIRPDSLFREILGGASLAFSVKILGVASAFAFNLFLARTLGAAEAGAFFLAVSVAEILTTAGRLGLEQGIVAVVGRCAPREEWGRVQGAFRRSTRLVLASSTVAALALYLCAPFLAQACFRAPALAPVLRIIALSIPLVGLVVYLGEALKGLGRLRDSQFVNAFCHHFLLLLAALALYRMATVQSVAWMYTATAGVTVGVGFALWRAATPQLRGLPGDFPQRELMATALPLLWVNLFNLANSRAVTLILGLFGTTQEVGVLSIALRISLLTNVAILAVGAFCAPRFAALHGSHDHRGLARVARRATALLIMGMFPAFLAMLAFPDWIMGLFGPEFASHGALLAVLAVGQCFNIATGPVSALLAMTGRQHLLRNVLLLATPLHIALQFALTPFFKGMGAAWAMAVNTMLVNLAAAYVVQREFGFWTFSPWSGIGRAGKARGDRP